MYVEYHIIVLINFLFVVIVQHFLLMNLILNYLKIFKIYVNCDKNHCDKNNKKITS